VYDFTVTDNSLGVLLAGGLEPAVYISSNPQWASDLPCAPIDTTNPAMVTAFYDFMYATVTHYPEVKIWALYNEPDAPAGDEYTTGGGCFASHTNGGLNQNGVKDYIEYAIMLKTAWKAVHTANPNAQLAVGALAFDSFAKNQNGVCEPSGYPGNCDGFFRYDFVTNLFGYMGNPANALPIGDKYMDMVLFNYYEIYGPFWETKAKGRGIQAKANVLRLKMQQANLVPVDLFVSETGLPSVSPFADKAGQARCVDITMVRGAAGGLKGIVWWTFRDFSDTDPRPDRREWKYGLVDQNMAPKPAYTAMQELTEQLNGFSYFKTHSGKKGFAGVEGYSFKSGTATKYVVWSSTIKSQSTLADCSWTRSSKLVSIKAKKIEIVDYMGATVKVIEDNKGKADKDKTLGRIGFKVAGDPKFVRVNP
jgi:hypothetical protein